MPWHRNDGEPELNGVRRAPPAASPGAAHRRTIDGANSVFQSLENVKRKRGTTSYVRTYPHHLKLTRMYIYGCNYKLTTVPLVDRHSWGGECGTGCSSVRTTGRGCAHRRGECVSLRAIRDSRKSSARPVRNRQG